MLVLTEEQEQLRELVAQVLTERAPMSRRRALRDAGVPVDQELWAELTELGLAGMLAPEDQGGLALGMVEVALVMEALGRHDAAVPLLSGVMAGPLLADQAPVAAGACAALAWREDGHRADPVVCEARWSEGRLAGHKVAVIDGPLATELVVSARGPEGTLGLYRVLPSQDLPWQRRVTIDHRLHADLRLDGLSAELLPGGAQALEQALDRGAIALSAELLGTMSAAFELARVHLCEREQFGRKLGSFQALQHRAVDCFARISQAQAVVLAAAQDPSPAGASLAKAWCSEAALHVCQEALQFLGGIGMTDEHDLGFFLKRARVGAELLGTSRHHRARWARLHGY